MAKKLIREESTNLLQIPGDGQEAEKVDDAEFSDYDGVPRSPRIRKNSLRNSKKYRTKRKHGTRHFIIAVYDCDFIESDDVVIIASSKKSHKQDICSLASQLSINNRIQERFSQTFDKIIVSELNFETDLDFVGLLQENPRVKKVLATYALSFNAQVITRNNQLNQFIQELNNESKAFIDMKYPFAIIFLHKENDFVPCEKISEFLRLVSFQYHEFKLGVLRRMINDDDDKDKVGYLDPVCNLPNIFILGPQFPNQQLSPSNRHYHEKCNNCESIRRMSDCYKFKLWLATTKDWVYKKILQHELLQDRYFSDAMTTYGLVNAGLFSEISGMQGIKSHSKKAVERNDLDHEVI